MACDLELRPALGASELVDGHRSSPSSHDQRRQAGPTRWPRLRASLPPAPLLRGNGATVVDDCMLSSMLPVMRPGGPSSWRGCAIGPRDALLGSDGAPSSAASLATASPSSASSPASAVSPGACAASNAVCPTLNASWVESPAALVASKAALAAARRDSSANDARIAASSGRHAFHAGAVVTDVEHAGRAQRPHDAGMVAAEVAGPHTVSGVLERQRRMRAGRGLTDPEE